MYFSVVTKTFFHQTGIFLLHSNLKMFFFSSFLFMVVEIKKLFGSLKPINFQRKNSANIFTDMLMMFKIFLLSGNWHFELFSERLPRNLLNLCTSWLVVTAEDGEKICRQFTVRYSLTFVFKTSQVSRVRDRFPGFFRLFQRYRVSLKMFSPILPVLY